MDIALILSVKYKGSKWSLNGDTYDGLTWLSEGDAPTEAELTALWPTVQYEVAYAQVEQARQSAYQATADPLFFQWQAGTATKEEWEAARQAIKDAHPYPEDSSATN